MSTNVALKDAKQLVDEFNSNEELRDLAFREEVKEHDRVSREDHARNEGEIIGIKRGQIIGVQKGKIIGINEGKKEGIIIGIKETQIGIAKKLLKKNTSISEIANLTELSISTIISLKNQIKK